MTKLFLIFNLANIAFLKSANIAAAKKIKANILGHLPPLAM
jgi:hypothetical protein